MSNSGWSNDSFKTLTVGTVTGEHFVINNPATGDALDIYDSGNNLVYAITDQGAAESIQPSDGRRVTVYDGAVQLLGANGYVDMFYVEPSPFLPSSQPELIIQAFGTGNSYALYLQAGSADGTQRPTLTGTEQNIQGSIMQSDGMRHGNLTHVSNYTGTVADAFGDVVINHGAAFTPSWGFLQAWDVNAAGQGWQLEWFQHPFSSTTMSFFVRNQSGGIPPVGTIVGVHAVLYK